MAANFFLKKDYLTMLETRRLKKLMAALFNKKPAQSG
jgi:hypothetical protein